MDSINPIIYLNLDQDKFVNNFWFPFDFPEDIIKLIAKKCYSIISEDDNFIPEVLVIFPIPSLKLKALIKYFVRDNKISEAYSSKSAIVYLFDEKDDNIYYRYMSYLDPYFQDTITTILRMEREQAEKEKIFEEIVKLQSTLFNLTKYLKTKSEYIPRDEISKDIIRDIDSVLKRKFKVVVLGEPSVGKTSTILRFTDNIFLRAYIPTMGLNITQKIFKVNNFAVELVIWDIGGQVKFEFIRRQFYEASNAFILLFDLTNPKSFATIPNWFYDMRNFNEVSPKLPGYLIGNKLDLINKRIIKKQDALIMANRLGLDYLEISALTGYNIEKVFQDLALKLLQ